MKKRLRKKLLKKALQGGPQAGETTVPDFASLFAVECWRIRKLLPELDNPNKRLVLNSSIEKMLDSLAGSGVEVEDPQGGEFRDGMTLKVEVFEETSTLPAGKKMISETLSPTVYVGDKLLHAARVIVSVGTGKP
jgi:hypothetical protein